MFFWNSLAFSMIHQMLAIWSLVPLPFLNPAWIFGSSWFTYCWSLAWKILSIYFANMWGECNCAVVWTFFGIAFLWDWNENWPFPVLWPVLSFPDLLAYCVEGRQTRVIGNSQNPRDRRTRETPRKESPTGVFMRVSEYGSMPMVHPII